MRRIQMMFMLLFLALAMTACGGGSYKGTINYTAAPDSGAAPVQCKQMITVPPFTDARPYHDIYVNRVGELKGCLGEVLQSIDLQESVSSETSKAFATFLNGKGCSANSGAAPGGSGFTLSGTLNDFFVTFFWAAKIGVDVDLKLTDNSTGQEVWKGKLLREIGLDFEAKYPTLRMDYDIDCSFGYECTARLLAAGINEAYADGMREAWDKNGLKEALTK